MVRLHIKKGDESQFLFDCSVDVSVENVLKDVTIIYNGRLKISRLCMEIEELANHGTMLPPNMMGLTDEQIHELKLIDEWGEKCTPSGGWTFNKDEIGRRNGRQPNEKMQEVLKKSVEEAKAIVSKKQVQAEIPLTQKMVQESLDMLRGAVTIVYPMGLPPHEFIRQEFENTEDLSGTQASLEIMDLTMASLWFSGKEMQRSKKMMDYLGKNEKTRAVIKLQKIGQGAPGREPVMSEADQKTWMMHAYHRQEEMKVGNGLSSGAQQISSGETSRLDGNFCKVESNPSAPILATEDDQCNDDSAEFVSSLLDSKYSEKIAITKPIMADLMSVSSGTDLSVFNFNLKHT